MSLYTIVGCGDSAKEWVPRGHTIGVNDCFKFGKQVDSLVICNRPSCFSADRMEVIKKTNPGKFYSHKSNWDQIFPNWTKIPLVTWYGTLYKWQIYSSNTISLIALSLAFNLGAKEIIMYGVDFVNHHLFNDTNPETKKEVDRHLDMIAQMEQQGCKVWLGANGTAFDNKLKLYK